MEDVRGDLAGGFGEAGSCNVVGAVLCREWWKCTGVCGDATGCVVVVSGRVGAGGRFSIGTIECERLGRAGGERALEKSVTSPSLIVCFYLIKFTRGQFTQAW